MLLNGACMIFSAAGILMISGTVGTVVFLLVNSQDRWSSQTSPHYVANAEFVAGVAVILAGMIAMCFMIVFDHTADTLLYTYVWNKTHGHNTVQKFATDTLTALTGYAPIPKSQSGGGGSGPPGGGGGWFGSFWGSSNASNTSETQPLVKK